MIRLVLRETDLGAAANLGGAVQTKIKTFDVELPEVELWLKNVSDPKWVARDFVGIEIIEPAQGKKTDIVTFPTGKKIVTTLEDEERYKKSLEFWGEKVRPIVEAARRSSRVTAEDLATYIRSRELETNG